MTMQTTTAPDLKETEFVIFGREFRIYFDRNLRFWSANEYDRHENIVWNALADTRDYALVYVGIQAQSQSGL